MTSSTPALVLEVDQLVVQTCSTLPGSDSSWTTRAELRVTSCSEGAGLVLGAAQLVQDFGIIRPQAGGNFASTGASPDLRRAGLVDDLVGLVARILVLDDSGTISIGRNQYVAIWWGVIHGQALSADMASGQDTGGQMTWTAVGIASVLDQIVLREGWVRSSDGSRVVDPGYLPAFNHQAGGDRSSATMTVNGHTVYVHQIADATTGNLWDASSILQLLLAGAAQPRLAPDYIAAGWSWALSDVDHCLGYNPEDLDLDGMTLLQALNTLCSAKRGLTWSVSVSGATATITVRSTVNEAISAGTFTLPAASATISLDVGGDRQVGDLVVVQDESATYDVIELRGAQPWVALTMVYDGTATGSLVKSWDTEEAGWALNPSSSVYEHVWRRFNALDAWDQTTAEAGIGSESNLLNTLGTGFSAAYGYYGFSGDRGYTAAADRVPARMIEPDRMLPCSPGFSTLTVGPRQRPVIVTYDGSVYEDQSQAWQVEMLDGPLGVRIDDGDSGQLLQGRMATPGAKLYVTIAVRENQPLRVSWQRELSDRPRATPRVKVIAVKGCELWRTANGAITGTTDGVSLDQSVGNTIRDDTPKLRALLALARAWYSVPHMRVSWTVRGLVETDSDFAPGTLLTSVQLGDRAIGIYAVITRRTWRRDTVPGVNGQQVETWVTEYETERIIPDLEAVL